GQALDLESLIATCREDVADLPFVFSRHQHNDPPPVHIDCRFVVSIAWLAREAKPQDFHWRRLGDRFESRQLPDTGESSISSDCQGCAYLATTAGTLVTNAPNHSVLFNQ